jgi:hypothetical protein
MRRRTAWMGPAVTTGVLACALVLAPAASAAGRGAPIVPLGFLGLPSLHSIIEAIAKGFFGALAGALVPGFLKHGTVSTIQHLVALPDPASWDHVGQLQDDMTYLGASLLPVTLAVGTLRYWMMGLTGSAHPAGAIGRCVGATGVLVAYRWIVEEAVAGTNTLTHAILGFPVVADGLASIISVLFGGALLVGAGGVFGAFLVIVGVLFAAGLFALQVLLTVVLALLIVAGPPLIALSAIPELSHLARTWALALMAVMLVPLGWTVLFATAGALTLDATSFTGGAGGLPGHVAAAFAGLITFVIAVKLPLMLLGEIRHLFGASSFRGSGGGGSQGQSTMPGAQRMAAAHARLRSAAFEGVPSLGRSAGRAAGAMGAPAGGPVGGTRRGLVGAARRSGVLPGVAAGTAGGSLAGAAAARRGVGTGAGAGAVKRGRPGLRERLSRAGTIIASAPRDARAAITASSRRATRGPARSAAARGAARGARSTGASSATGKTPASVAAAGTRGQRAGGRAAAGSPRSTSGPSSQAAPRVQLKPRTGPPPAGQARAGRPTPGPASGAHPGRKVSANARREAATPAKPPNTTPKAAGGRQARPEGQRSKAARPAPPPPVKGTGQRPPVKRRPRPRSGP